VRVRAFASLLVAALLVSASAAATPTARLVYARGPGAETCPDEEALAALVAARLGYGPFRPIADNTLFAEVRREAGAFTADVKLVDGQGIVRGARHLASAAADCGDLAGALALSMSIALDPLSLTRPPPPPLAASSHETPSPTSSPAPEASAVKSPEAPPAGPPLLPPPDTSPKFHAGIGPTMSFGTSPAPAVGLSAFGGVRWRSLSLDLGGRMDLPASRGTNVGGAARTSLAAAYLAPCAHMGPAFGCAAVWLGSLSASAVAVSEPKSASGLFFAGGPRVGATVGDAGAFELRMFGDALFVFTPFDLRLNGRPVFAASTLALTLTLAGVFHFS
jgi:hypothetical protein